MAMLNGKIARVTVNTREYELEARLLVKICGWRWLRNNKQKLCGLFPTFDAKEGEWEMSPKPFDESKVFEAVDGVPPESERFSDWTKCCMKRGDFGGSQFIVGMPALTTDPAAAAMLKSELVKRKIFLNIMVSENGKLVVSVGDQISKSAEYSPQAECLALCQAADMLP